MDYPSFLLGVIIGVGLMIAVGLIVDQLDKRKAHSSELKEPEKKSSVASSLSKVLRIDPVIGFLLFLSSSLCLRALGLIVVFPQQLFVLCLFIGFQFLVSLSEYIRIESEFESSSFAILERQN